MSVITQIEVVESRRLTPHFLRVTFTAPELADFGTGGPLYDQRIKLIFGMTDTAAQRLTSAGDDWWPLWQELPESERGQMRTYSVREVVAGPQPLLVVDFVLHIEPGFTGPASEWAAAAVPGDRLVVVGPRVGAGSRGIEFSPGDAERLVLAGDETAVPAVSRILGDLDPDAVGQVFLEVPTTEDVLDVPTPAGVEVTWLPRDGAGLGGPLTDAVVDHFGASPVPSPTSSGTPDEPALWETPEYSAAGEPLTTPGGTNIPGVYVWIAGESRGSPGSGVTWSAKPVWTGRRSRSWATGAAAPSWVDDDVTCEQHRGTQHYSRGHGNDARRAAHRGPERGPR